MSIFRTVAAAGAILMFALIPTAYALDGVQKYQVEGSFEDVYFDLENAVIDQGLVIDNVSHVSEMLDRTGKDVGSTKPIYVDGRTVSFCSAKLSRAAMEADLDNLVFCPYSIFIYESAARPGSVTIGYRKLGGASDSASRKAIDAVNNLLGAIIKSAIGE